MSHVTKRLQAYVDNESDPQERRRIEHHCAGCTACAAELAALQTVWTGVARAALSATEPGLPESFGPRLLRRLAGRGRRDDLGWAWPAWRWRPGLQTGLAGAAAIAGLAAGLLVGGLNGVGSAEVDRLGSDDTVSLLAESSNLYGGDWALDRIWSIAADEEESAQ
jgi:anti-sigma factor RsiW